MVVFGYILAAVVLLGVGTMSWYYVYDRWIQRDHAIRRNFPIYGRFRYIMENLGEYFRQYWFTADWEERPFNRLTRAWVYRSAKGVSNYVAFGSEVDSQQPGHIYFLHSAFPINDDEAEIYTGKWIGKGIVGRRCHGGRLDGYRRGRPVVASSERRLRHLLPDRHGEIRRARCQWQSG